MAERSIVLPQSDIEDFFKSKINRYIDEIKGDETALWGDMTVHHMLEHLLFPLDFAITDSKLIIFTPEEQLPKLNAFLHSDLGLIKNFKTPLLPKDKLVPLQQAQLDDAKKILKERIVLFIESINKSGFTSKVHPIFGILNKEEWLSFQYKHFTHHFSQFGILFQG